MTLNWKQFMVKFLKQCNEEFLEENPLDDVDISIVDNYTDYIVERFEIFMDNLERTKRDGIN